MSYQSKSEFFEKQFPDVYQRQILDQYGPFQSKLADFASAPVNLENIARNSPPYTELNQSGVKTATIIYETLSNFLSNAEFTQLDSPPHAWEVALVLYNVFEQLLGYFLESKSIVPEEFWTIETLKNASPQWIQQLTNVEKALIEMNLPFEVADINSLIFIHSRQLFQLEEKTVIDFSQQLIFWWSQNIFLSVLKLLPHDSLYLDAERLQVTFPELYVLVVDGKPYGKIWKRGIIRFLTNENVVLKNKSLSPTLLILYNESENDNETETYFESRETFNILWLPIAELADKLTELASQFGTEPYIFRPSSKNKYPARLIIPDSYLGRANWLTINREGIGISPTAVSGELPSAIIWQTQKAFVFRVANHSTAEVEASIRWRAELEKGLVVGAGTALYRAGLWLVEQFDEHDSLHKIEPVIRSYLSQAVQAPLDFLLANFDEEREAVLDWLKTAPNSFKLEEGEDGVFQIKTGTSLEIGLFTPIPEIVRIIEQALVAVYVRLLDAGT